MKIDPISNPTANIHIRIIDDQCESDILFYENRVWFDFERLEYFMDTTDTFHVYRIIGQGNIVRVFVDEKLIMDNGALHFIGINRANMTIRSSSSVGYSKAYLDYFSYDTNPNITLTQPTLTVVDGTSSYYISNLTGATVENSLIVLPNGIYASWCIDKYVTMIRNESHNVQLYSSLNKRMIPYDNRWFNWSSVNYILNHKQGSMKEIQNAIWYFVPDQTSPSLNETNTWNMIDSAKANSNYVPGKGDIMAIIAYAGHYSVWFTSGNSGVQNTILEYRIP